MDAEVVSAQQQMRLEVNCGPQKNGNESVLKRFTIALIKARGHITLLELGYPDSQVGRRLDHIRLFQFSTARNGDLGLSERSNCCRHVATGRNSADSIQARQARSRDCSRSGNSHAGGRRIRFVRSAADSSISFAVLPYVELQRKDGRESHNMAKVRLASYQRTLKSCAFGDVGESLQQQEDSIAWGSEEWLNVSHRSLRKAFEYRSNSVEIQMSGSPGASVVDDGSGNASSQRSRSNTQFGAEAGRAIGEDVVMETF